MKRNEPRNPEDRTDDGIHEFREENEALEGKRAEREDRSETTTGVGGRDVPSEREKQNPGNRGG